jgi:hypothetical protein
MTMPSIDLNLIGDDAWPDWADKRIQRRTAFRMTGLRDGTDAGRPSIIFAVELDDGTVVALETTLRLLENSIAALKARWKAFP